MPEEPVGCAKPTGTVIDELKKLSVEVLSVSSHSTFVHKIWEEEGLSQTTKDGILWPMVADGTGNLGKV